ncbi:MAG: RNA polymerase sigma factor [Planctomycetaceae bacterium]
MTDTELLRQAQGGDRAAWSLLYARCLPSLWRHAVASVDDYPAAEDVVSETLLAFVRGLATLDPDTVDLHVWLRGILRRKIVDHFRQKRKQKRIHAVALEQSPDGEVPSPTGLEVEEDQQLILTAFEGMPELQRCVLEWQHIEGLSVRDMAERTGKTEKAIESILYRARKEFRRLYERICSESHVAGNGSSHTSEAFEKSL